MNERDKHTLDIIRGILDRLGVSYEDIRIDADEQTGTTSFMVHTKESALLIGERGTRLQALNHLVKRILERKTNEGEQMNIMVDVNEYQKKHIDELRNKARMLAERARYFKSSVDMEPMSAYERMIIHSEFAKTPDILTESSGKGRERHIVLRFTESKVVA
jgi:spoIIIJ-associated protein